ncbi:MAG TPA: alpha/beta fold hydrolase [Kribbellaceae bacterium]|nr:alpha/beta fold hydrolase [Kribbellaceae bacterium]
MTGAFNDRRTCAPLAKLLEDRFTVVTYDRRGKGDSGDTAPYAVEREIEDLAAVIAAVDGGPANVFGFSSGAVLALKAAVARAAIRSLALYEAPTGSVPMWRRRTCRIGSRGWSPPGGGATPSSCSRPRSSACRRSWSPGCATRRSGRRWRRWRPRWRTRPRSPGRPRRPPPSWPRWRCRRSC